MATITEPALDFARQHISRFYDTDFYPRPLEFQALWAFWPEVKERFLGHEIEEVSTRSMRAMVAPKPNGSYRVVHQLDPLDSIMYTAMAYTVASAVESAREPVDRTVACSYRIEVEAESGNFFRHGNGYGAFVDKSRALAAEYDHVLVVDLVDFYNQVYIHRLQNAIEYADPDLEDLSRDIEDYLMRLNNKVSRGVPVGPAASIIMTEAVLIDVDQHIRGAGFEHTRYVDDFHIFGNTEHALEQFLRSLVLYLHDVHRLVVSAAKTRVYDSAEFVAVVIDDPESVEEAALHSRIARVEPIPLYDFLGVDEPQRHVPSQDVQRRTEVLQDIMTQIIRRPRLSLGLARHVLRKSRRLRLRAIVPQLLENFDLFAPVISDVVLYLRGVTNARFVMLYQEQMEHIAVSSRALDTPLVGMWFLQYLSDYRDLVRRPRIAQAVRDRGDISVHARHAATTRDLAWVRQYRDRLATLGEWDRRAVLGAARIVPRQERRPWLSTFADRTDDPLDRWFARWIASL